MSRWFVALFFLPLLLPFVSSAQDPDPQELERSLSETKKEELTLPPEGPILPSTAGWITVKVSITGLPSYTNFKEIKDKIRALEGVQSFMPVSEVNKALIWKINYAGSQQTLVKGLTDSLTTYQVTPKIMTDESLEIHISK